MPIHDFQCMRLDCLWAQTDVYHKLNEDPHLVCSQCNGTEFFRIVATPAFTTYGSGFDTEGTH